MIDYFIQKYASDHIILNSEMEVSMDTPLYVLSGRIDLLIKENDMIKLLDFKSQKRREINNLLLKSYYNQLCIYAKILSEKYGQIPEKYYIYWTDESQRDNALMEFEVSEDAVIDTMNHFDRIATFILQRNFVVEKIP